MGKREKNKDNEMFEEIREFGQIKLEDEWISHIKTYMSDSRFEHTLGVTTVAVYLSEFYDVDKDLVRKTALLHDIAKDMSPDEMANIAGKYGHQIQDISLQYEANLHAEIGALIAEHEFGLSDKDALNAIRFHVCARPDMSLLEKIIFLSDHAEPQRPNQPMLRTLIEIAKTDINLSILRMLRVVIEYQVSNSIPKYVCDITSEAYDYLLEDYCKTDQIYDQSPENNDILSDEEFDEAFELIRCNQIKLKSVENARWIKDLLTNSGRKIKDGLLIRSGSLHQLTDEEADYLNTLGLSLVIDLRTPMEVAQAPDKSIAGVRYENIPLVENIDTSMMDYLTQRYMQSLSETDRAWYVEQYARIDEVIKMYRKISMDARSLDSIHRIFQLLRESPGTILFHCTSGKDRTGIIAALLLLALGCDKKYIISDYNASAVTLFTKTESIKADLGVRGNGKENLKRGLQTSISVVPEVLRSGLYYIENNYFSNDSFIFEATGCNDRELELLRNKFLV